MSAAIIDKIRKADNLPSLPTVAMEVLRMTQVEDVSAADIALVVQQDPALTGKILKVVNSSLFGMPREISSVQQAMVVLGLRTVKVMVLSFSLVDSMNTKTAGGLDLESFWRRSLTASAAVPLRGAGNQLVIARKGSARLPRVALGHARAALDVGEQEGETVDGRHGTLHASRIRPVAASLRGRLT